MLWCPVVGFNCRDLWKCHWTLWSNHCPHSGETSFISQFKPVPPKERLISNSFPAECLLRFVQLLRRKLHCSLFSAVDFFFGTLCLNPTLAGFSHCCSECNSTRLSIQPPTDCRLSVESFAPQIWLICLSKLIAPCWHNFPCTLNKLQVIARNSNRFVMPVASVVIGIGFQPVI